MSSSGDVAGNAVAVIGMAARLPGAATVSAFWDNLRAGRESIVTLSEDELVAAGVDDAALASHAYVRRAALLDGIDEFDAEFFGFTPQAARMTDPQHRLFLQSAFHALQDAGYDPGRIEGSVGVYATSTTSGYLLHNLMSHQDPHAVIGQGVTFEMVSLSLQNDKDYLATKVAHQFDLRGPALSVQTACSSALVAVHLACQAILNGECEMALAGGASLRIPHRVGYWYEPGSMVSASGHCRPFDVRSDGTIFGSGVGVVVLKALPDAVADGDRIHAVIRGSALNNDGATKMTYAAPNAAGQADVIAEAHAVAEVDAATISYVETHGTGTPLGDPIEIEGLRQAFAVSQTPRSGPCFIGSVKSNIGHLESAAGIAGLIKTILCLKHRALPATLHYTSPNPELHVGQGPFVVRDAYGPWQCDGVRRAGVSSFGVGGTNAHVVLEEAPPVAAPAVVPSGPQVLVLSARSAEALGQARGDLAAELARPDQDGALADVAYTLTRRRKDKAVLAAVVQDRADAATVLGAEEHDNVFIGESVSGAADNTARVVFLFPGQGAQHVGMARGLYESEPVFAEHFDACAAGFNAELGIDLRAEVFEGTARNLERTDRTQPALFTVQYALARLLESYAVTPAVMAGHSIGEYAAATVAGVFDLATAVQVVAMRARLMHTAPRGVMVAVAAGAEDLAAYLGGEVDIAAVNEPGGCVVAGSQEAIRGFSARVAQQGMVVRRVRTSHAFHSRLMESMIGEFTGFLSRQTLREPQIPLLSNVTGTWLSAGEATNPAIWARQVRATVRFADELDVVLADPHRVVIEVGPGGTLTAAAVRHPRWAATHRAVRLMRHHAQNRDDRDTFLLGLGQLWAAGIDVNWSALHGDRPQLVSLPGYAFERHRHWVDYNPAGRPAPGATAPAAAAAGAGAASSNGGSPMEATLQRIWAQCLGVQTVSRSANFFELGGDSLVAISVAMTASHEGLDVTPQDLYDHPSIAGLAKTLTARYAAGGLTRPTLGQTSHPPLPPNLAALLDHGRREPARWRIPLLLRVAPEVSIQDITAVLTAVTHHHQALRLQLTRRGGSWEQTITDPEKLAELTEHRLPEDLSPASPQQRDAVRAVLQEQINGQDLSSSPLTATYIHTRSDGPNYLALSVAGIAADTASRDILLTDLFTAFGQHLAGQPITLQPASTSWTEWCQRAAALATHPAVLDSRDHWLHTTTSANLRLTPHHLAEAPRIADLARVTSALTVAQTTEIDDARRRLAVSVEELLLAALARTLATHTGEGTYAVDLTGPARSVLKPDVDLRRTIGWFDTIYPIALHCTTDPNGDVKQLLNDIHHTLTAVPHHGIGYGLLRYLYAPTAQLLSATPRADIFFSHQGTIPDLPPMSPDDAPVQFDADTAMPVRETIPGLGHPIELRTYRNGGQLHLHWWHDTRTIDTTTAQTLADTFTTTLRDLIQQAVTEKETDDSDDELALVDLSSTDTPA